MNRVRIRETVFWLVATALFVLLFWPTFVWLAERFDAHDSFYSHGWLIPVASAWLIWQRRGMLQSCRVRESVAGLWLLIPSLLLHVVATRWHLHFVSGFAMLATVWGFVWTCSGWSVLWALRMPMLFLLFMIPLPGVLLISVSFRMKLLAATLATHALHLFGIHAVQAGSTIQVPGVSVIVDDTCSGLRSLISLIALATLWTSFMPPSAGARKRWVMVAASLPIALAANVVRITVLVLLAAIYGPKIADGFVHFGSGLVVFGVSLIVLAWLNRRLASSSARAGFALEGLS